MNPEAASKLDGTEARIAWLLAYPSMSAWLKQTLRAAFAADPVTVVDDVELPKLLLRSRTEARLSMQLEGYANTTP